MDTGKSGLTRDDIELMAAKAKMGATDLVPSTYGGILDSLAAFAEQVCKWQRERDVRICDEVAEMMASRPNPDHAFGGKAAASHCANFITLGRVIKS